MTELDLTQGPLTRPWNSRLIGAGLVAVAVAALVAGNAAGRPGLAAAVIAVQLALVAAWLLIFSAQPDAAVLVVIAVGAADVVLLRTRAATAGSIAGVIGLSVVALLMHQLVRRDPRSVTGAICMAVGAVVLGCGLALLLPLHQLAGGRSTVLTGLLAGGAALVVVRLLPGAAGSVGADAVRRGPALLVGLGVALLCGLPAGGLSAGEALGVGAGAAGAALLTDRVLDRVDAPSVAARLSPQLGGRTTALLLPVLALLPLAFASPVAYLAGRVIAGGAG